MTSTLAVPDGPWFLTADGRRLRLTDAFTYRFYAQGPEAKLRRLAGQLRSRHWAQHAYSQDKTDFATGLTRPALCLEVAAYEYPLRLLAYLGALEEDLSFYNCDWTSLPIIFMPGSVPLLLV